MNKILMIAAALAFGLPVAAPALAQGNAASAAHPAMQRCHDAHGRFTRCPPAAAHRSGATRDAHGRCHGPDGRFVACPH